MEIDFLRIPIPSAQAHGLFLVCRDVRVSVREPGNLLGLVAIKTPEQAMEFLRLFSRRDLADTLSLNGMVQIEPREGSEESDEVYTVPKAVFARLGKQGAKEITQEWAGSQVPGKEPRREFQVHRVVLLQGGTICAMDEVIAGDGYIQLLSKRIVGRKTEGLGLR